MFGGAVGAQYIFKGGKPKRAGYLRAMEMMGTDRKTTLFVGDQLFTDVWGAKNAGIYSILVKQIDSAETLSGENCAGILQPGLYKTRKGIRCFLDAVKLECV